MPLTTSAVPRRQPHQDVVCYDDLLQGILGKAAEARAREVASRSRLEIPWEIPWKSTIETSLKSPKVVKSPAIC